MLWKVGWEARGCGWLHGKVNLLHNCNNQQLSLGMNEKKKFWKISILPEQKLQLSTKNELKQSIYVTPSRLNVTNATLMFPKCKLNLYKQQFTKCGGITSRTYHNTIWHMKYHRLQCYRYILTFLTSWIIKINYKDYVASNINIAHTFEHILSKKNLTAIATMLQRMISWQREFPKNLLGQNLAQKNAISTVYSKRNNGITLYILVSQDFLQTVTTQNISSQQNLIKSISVNKVKKKKNFKYNTWTQYKYEREFYSDAVNKVNY